MTGGENERKVEALGIYTIGHSNHAPDKLMGLLKKFGVTLVVDVRSSPYSGYNAQFNRENLEALLEPSGIEYAFHGNSLGGRPSDRSCYDEGELDYAKVREKDWFQDGISYVCWEGQNRCVALLCAEEEPADCHRHNLIAQALLERNVEVTHIRGNGTAEAATRNKEQLRLL